VQRHTKSKKYRGGTLTDGTRFTRLLSSLIYVQIEEVQKENMVIATNIPNRRNAKKVWWLLPTLQIEETKIPSFFILFPSSLVNHYRPLSSRFI
jgi:hypothetical protein